MAYADCGNSDFSGAYFRHTIVTSTVFRHSIFSCPSIFSINLAEAKTLQGAVYKHLGEIECDLSSAPLVVNGLEKQVILMNDATIIGADLQRIPAREKMKNFLNGTF